MNALENRLYRRKVSLHEACEEFGIPVEDAQFDLETCSHCSIWFKPGELIPDLDGNPICKVCNRFYGL